MGACAAGGDDSKNPKKIESKKLDKYIKDHQGEFKQEIKLLLLGPGESGKSTVFKQMKIIQDGGCFTTEERISFRNVIFSNAVSQMRVILEASILLKIQLKSEQAVQAAQKILNLPASGNSWSQDIGTAVKLLWQDEGVKETFNMGMKKYQLNETASYFFENVDRFLEDNYVPSYDDILRVRVRSTGIEEATFTFDKLKLRVVDVGGQRSERRKWIHCFDCVTAVIYCASLSGYDQVLREDRTQNRMHEAILLFDEVANSASFQRNDIILFLNKYDLFREKIATIDLNVCFSNYTGGCNEKAALDFIKKRFEERVTNQQTSLYIHETTATDTENIKHVISNVRETLLRHTLQKIGLYEDKL